jgi:hypothetical protein
MLSLLPRHQLPSFVQACLYFLPLCSCNAGLIRLFQRRRGSVEDTTLSDSLEDAPDTVGVRQVGKTISHKGLTPLCQRFQQRTSLSVVTIRSEKNI